MTIKVIQRLSLNTMLLCPQQMAAEEQAAPQEAVSDQHPIGILLFFCQRQTLLRQFYRSRHFLLLEVITGEGDKDPEKLRSIAQLTTQQPRTVVGFARFRSPQPFCYKEHRTERGLQRQMLLRALGGIGQTID